MGTLGGGGSLIGTGSLSGSGSGLGGDMAVRALLSRNVSAAARTERRLVCYVEMVSIDSKPEKGLPFSKI